LWGKEDVRQRTEGQSESSRRFETTEGRSVSHSYTERSRVRIQDVLDLHTGEFYGQLVDSDFSSFKAQVKAPEGGPLPEMVPVTLVTSQDVKKNFLRIQDEIESLLHRQQPQAIAERGPVESKTPPVNGHSLNDQPKRDEPGLSYKTICCVKN
jgi:hypothetical protein